MLDVWSAWFYWEQDQDIIQVETFIYFYAGQTKQTIFKINFQKIYSLQIQPYW